MILTALALVLAQDTSTVMQRMESFFAQHPSFQAHLKFTSYKGDHAEGTLYESRPSKIAYKNSSPTETYQFSRTPEGVIETCSATKVYDEYNSRGNIATPQSEITISDWRLAMPIPLFFNKLSEYFPPDTKIASVGEATINGVVTDAISMKIEHAHWKYTAFLNVDRTGRLLRYVTQDPKNPKIFVNVDVSDYQYKPLGPESFKLAILPKGYTLLELPEVPQPLMWDHKLPSSNVIDGSGSQHSLAALVGNNSLLAVVDAAWASSAIGKKALQDVQKVLTDQKAGKVVLLSSDPGKPKTKVAGLNYDPSGKALDTLCIPGSPSFFLINKKGLIERIWCGYSPADRTFLPELKTAITNPEDSRPD